MRISDWSSDVCSSDLHCRVEQDRLECLAVNDEECEREQEPCRSLGQRLAHRFLDILLPGIGMRLAMHPDAHRNEHECGKDSTKALSQLAARAADGDEIGRAHV